MKADRDTEAEVTESLTGMLTAYREQDLERVMAYYSVSLIVSGR